MTPSAADLFAGVALVLAVVVSGLGAAVAFRVSREAKEVLDSLRKADTPAAIASADLGALGFNLFERLGGTTVRAYTWDSEVRSDFDEAFNSIRAYLGTEEQAPEPTERPRSDAARGAKSEAQVRDLSAVEGEMWAELARARRDLEIELRTQLGVPESDARTWSGRRLLNAAAQRGFVDARAVVKLENALTVVNRAIHGLEVDSAAAQRSLVTVNEFLASRANRPSAAPKSPVSRAELHVTQDGSGNWVARRRGSQRTIRANSQREAIDRARDVVHKAGGGEVIIHGADGRIRSKDTVRGRESKSPRSPDADVRSKH